MVTNMIFETDGKSKILIVSTLRSLSKRLQYCSRKIEKRSTYYKKILYIYYYKCKMLRFIPKKKLNEIRIHMVIII